MEKGCKSKDIMAAFKKEILTRFIGTDEGEVTEYLEGELIRHRSAKTAKLVQRGYAERLDCGTASHVLLHRKVYDVGGGILLW